MKKLRYEKSLLAVNPALAAEWHPTKNGTLSPDMVSVRNQKKAWWLGKCGHEWEAIISSRNNGNSCPYCSNQKLLKGFNDLAATNPELAAEWHPTKNGDLSPADVTPISSRKVWWLGKCGHDWESLVNSRSKGLGCPYCANRKLLKGFNDLATTNPELAEEWHPTKNGDLRPDNVILHTGYVVWWKCSKCGYEWQKPIALRKKGGGCPNCRNHNYNKLSEKTNKSLLKRHGSLSETNPNLAAEWHPTKNGDLSPADVTPNSNMTVWWLGECGHEWEAIISSRNNGNSCPYCAYRKLLKGFNDLATTNPKLAEEWHPTKNGDLRPDNVISHTGYEVWWKCSQCGYEWQRTIALRKKGSGCPNCRNHNHNKLSESTNMSLLKKRVSLSETNSNLAAEWHPTKNGDLSPADVTPNSNMTVWWLGECGHEWATTVNNRAVGYGCPYCTKRKVLKGFNDLATTNPELAAEWHPSKNGDLRPDNVISHNGVDVWWKCSQCGYEWQRTIALRKKGSRCPRCRNNKIAEE